MDYNTDNINSELRLLNVKSDFDFILRVVDCQGRNLGFPNFDFRASIYSDSLSNAFIASCYGSICSNCFNDSNRIHVVVDRHSLGIGRVWVNFAATVRDTMFPDGMRNIVVKEATPVKLVPSGGEISNNMVVTVTLPLAAEQMGVRPLDPNDDPNAEELTEEEILKIIGSEGSEPLIFG